MQEESNTTAVEEEKKPTSRIKEGEKFSISVSQLPSFNDPKVGRAKGR